MREEKKHTGVVAELNGKFWGIQYEDGRERNEDFGPIEKATISNPRYCGRPEDMVYAGHPRRNVLTRARLLPITVTTIYEVGESSARTGAEP